MNQLTQALVAQEAGGGGEAGGGQAPVQGCQQMGGMLVPLLLMFAIIYFMIIRPQQKQQKKHQAMLGALSKGDQIITNAGIFGKVVNLTEGMATIEIAKNVHIRILRGQIAGLQPTGGEEVTAAVVPDADKK